MDHQGRFGPFSGERTALFVSGYAEKPGRVITFGFGFLSRRNTQKNQRIQKLTGLRKVELGPWMSLPRGRTQ
jgi:hypothetical protein